MGVPISNVTRRVVYAASGTGPYAFTFEILANTDVAVYRDDTLLTLTTDYTVTIAGNGTGSITLVAAPTGATQIAIVGNRTIQRTTDFVTGGDFFANTVNDEMDQQTIFAQQNAEGLQRALSAPQTDPTSINMTLPRAALRANKALGFDANGNPVIADTLGTNRGNWASGTLYYVRDIIKDTTNSNIWQCIVQHTSSGSQPIGTNADAAKWTLLVDAAAAATSATNAAASASAASSSASAASTSASNASSSASTASTQASNASTSATNAASSASAASSSASTASTAATNAGNSATAAATSATNASNSASAASTSASNASSSASAASTSASNASTSATNAANSATAASGSASTASTQATNAASSATSAAGSATSAASAQTAAEAARDATLAAYDSFDDRYLGAKTSDPSVDNDGNALVAGALYFNSVDGAMKLYTGSAWVAAYVSGSGYLASANNLSDLANAATARANLGLTIGTNVLAPNGSAANLTSFPTLNQNTTGNAATATLATTATNLANGSVGTIPYQSASGTTAMLAAGTAGQVLTSNGAAAPTWAAPPASAGTVTATASGSLSNGSTVVLNSDGTVSVVAASSASASASIPLTAADSARGVYSTSPGVTASFDPSTNTVVVYYCSTSDDYLWAVAGTISNGVITFGTGALNIFAAPVTGGLQWGFGAVYIPSVNRHVVFFNRNSGDVVSRMVYTSGSGTATAVTSVSGGDQTIFSGSVVGPKCVYDPTSGKAVVVACNLGASNAVQVCTVTVTATTITANAVTTVMSGGYNHSPAICLDATDNKILVLGQGSASYVRAAVGTISGTSISFGTPAVIEAVAGAFYNTYAIAYSIADSKVFVAYGVETGVSTVRGAIGTVSGTSISFGTPQTFGYGASSNRPFSAAYYATTGKIYFLQNYVQWRIDISGSTFTAANEFYYSSNVYASLQYLPGLDMLLAVGDGYFGGNYRPAVSSSIAYTTNINSNNFLGFSSAAYTNGQTATINTVGSAITNQSGLTTATKYYVGPGGTLNTNSAQPYAGLAMSATKLVVKG